MSCTRKTSRSVHGGSSAGLVAFLALAAVGVGLYMGSRRTEPPRKIAEDDLPQIAALARAEKEAEWAQRAIREHRAIVGMNYREVELAKGAALTKERAEMLTEAERAKGAVEKWTFRPASGEPNIVLFGASGLVVYSSDVGDKPRPGQIIRR